MVLEAVLDPRTTFVISAARDGHSDFHRCTIMADKAVANVQKYFKELECKLLGNFKKLSKQLGTKSDNEGLRDLIQSLRSKIDSLVRVLKDDGLDRVQKKTYKDKFKSDFDSLMKQYKQLNAAALEKERKFEVRGSKAARSGDPRNLRFYREQNQARRQTQIAANRNRCRQSKTPNFDDKCCHTAGAARRKL